MPIGRGGGSASGDNGRLVSPLVAVAAKLEVTRDSGKARAAEAAHGVDIASGSYPSFWTLSPESDLVQFFFFNT